MSRISKSMKGQGFTKTFPSIYIQSMINWFLVMELYNFLPEWFLNKNSKKLLCLLSGEICSPQSCLFCQQLPQLLRKQESYKNLRYFDTFCVKTKL